MLDAGATPEGRLYFAMEYVADVPINEFCDCGGRACRFFGKSVCAQSMRTKEAASELTVKPSASGESAVLPVIDTRNFVVEAPSAAAVAAVGQSFPTSSHLQCLFRLANQPSAAISFDNDLAF